MNWADRALVIGARPHGEAAVILELLTRERGRHLGLVHGGRSRRLRPVLQPGNTVLATWRARLDEQLGTFTVEPERMRAGRIMASSLALYGVAALGAHLRLFAERDPHPALFDAADELVEHLDEPASAAALMARFELGLLAELGFGLDLSVCAATGSRHDLAYVSPRTGRAVGRAAGEPYRERLFHLPAFLAEDERAASPDALAAAFRLTAYFLEARAYGPRGAALPHERARFVALACGAAPDREAGNLGAQDGERADSVRTGTG